MCDAAKGSAVLAKQNSKSVSFEIQVGLLRWWRGDDGRGEESPSAVDAVWKSK